MPYSIMLDAGHGGRDPGAVYNGRQEKDDTLKLTLAIGQILQNNGLDVEYTSGIIGRNILIIKTEDAAAVSYTHQTMPTILRV